MNYWLMKTEPNEYSYDDLEREGETVWDGVRNHQAQSNMKAMAVGDWVLIYHSVGPKEIVGIATVSQTATPDPKAAPGEKWVVVKVKPKQKLKKSIHLSQIKATPSLQEVALIRQSRLSVMPLSKAQYDGLLALG